MAVSEPKKSADPQEVYARWLHAGSIAAFVFAIVAFLLYVSGVLPPVVPLADLPRLWQLPAAELLRAAHAPGGWDWLPVIWRGDYLNLAGICLFSLISLACAARVAPAFLRSGERVQALLAIAQVVVLVAAASNLIPGAR